jgi:prepilin signal peptidase PulO-like enzyme (type II secretory pathway)
MIILAIFFILGLIIGSFLNVVVYRAREVETLLGRSHCPKCKKIIHWYDNIPLLSYLLLKARCRNCKKNISWQYPLVEAATGIIFVLTALYLIPPADPLHWLHLLFYLGIFSVFIVIFVYDAKYMEIPMSVLWIGVFWAVLYYLILDASTYNTAMSFTSLNIFSAGLSAAAAFLFFFALSYFSKETWMGAGDAYVALLVGLVTGWPLILFAMLCSFILGSVWGGALIAIKKKNMKSQIPFAPFLVSGAVLIIFLSQMVPSLKYYILWSL